MEKTKEQLIKNIIGQLEGIDKMISDNRDCVSVLTQMKAANSAFDSLISKYLKENLTRCVSSDETSDKELMDKLIIELVKN